MRVKAIPWRRWRRQPRGRRQPPRRRCVVGPSCRGLSLPPCASPASYEFSLQKQKGGRSLCRPIGLKRMPYVRSVVALRSASFEREGNDEVAGKRPLRALRSSAERRGVVQRRVVANLRPDNEAFELFRNRRLDGKSERQRTVGRRSAADRDGQGIAMLDPDKVQVAREGG